ncbi:enterobactin synthetase component F [Azospirillum fermentarium]|uniref:amino acid adenylation domain-containing protein n=1 Tax=Azospirillum fermentarium TaxID=1233114 RepID=UPI002225D681|nr:amino acid adenylation domain-containing protein [Azospirillum fermentarium]MCW2246934.1 enterobactin synthetase component F [Azospirillum fermentarium]
MPQHLDALALPAMAPPRSAPLPLLEAQLGLWYAQRLEPDNPAFNTAHCIEIDGRLEIAALAWAVRTALGEADGLTVRFGESDGEPFQWTGAPVPELGVVDLCAAPDPAAAAEAAMARDLATPLDPTRDPLVRETLFILGPGRHVWYQRIHHLVIDGYGFDLLTRRIAGLYTARLTGDAPGPALSPYGDLLAEDAAYRLSERRRADRAYWLEVLGSRPPGKGPMRGLEAGMAPDPASHGPLALRCDAALDDLGAGALDRLAAAAGVGWPDALVALVAAYVRRHLGEGGDDGESGGDGAAMVGVPHMNRFGSVASGTPATVMNVLPVWLPIDEDAPLPGFVAEAARHLRLARRHGRYRSEQVRRDLRLFGPDRRLYGPIINVVPFDGPPVLPQAVTRLRILGSGPVEDLTITLRADSRGRNLRLRVEANPHRYAAAAAAVHACRLARFLETAVAAPRLAEVPTLTPEEHRRWTIGINDTAHPVAERTLTDLIGAALARSPDAVALTFGGIALSNRAFACAVERLARRLAAAGVRRGDVVGVALPRSPDLVVALAAVLRVGAAYLPIDPDHPPGRIARILGEARPRLILGDAASASRLPPDIPVLRPDGPGGGMDVPIEPPQPEDAAYILYTSGSTGVPKGVVTEHRAIVNRLEWMRTRYAIGPDDRILQKTPATFDVSVWEFFLPLIAGATLVVAPPSAHKDPAWIARLLREERITTVHFVPSMLALFLSEPSAEGIVLRRVFCSGEELPAVLRDRFHRTAVGELHNLYGPTEAAIDVTHWAASPGDRSVPVPIGHPVWNTALYVLDRRLRPVPPGVAGDLYIAGRQVARGYLNRPALTAERFSGDPFAPPGPSGGARMYRTGDIARRRADGALEFLGRSDHQVKLRGMRIELGDIEAAVHAAGPAGPLAVILREDHPGGPRLVAYVTPASAGAAIDPAALQMRLAAHLPEPLIPAIVVLPALPLTANGKLDRTALPPPGRAAAAGRRPPATDTERRLVQLFTELLAPPDACGGIGADDDFFRLGGHSLLAARAIQRIRAAWPVTVGLGALFAHPTPARLAAHLDTLCGARRPGAPDAGGGPGPGGREGLDVVLPLVEGGGEGAPPVFCIHPAGGIGWCYVGLGRAIGAGRAVYGVQARGLDPAQPLPAGLTEMAADYLAQIRAIQPRGPCHLVGWSAGGIIAHEMAVQLAAAGGLPGALVLLDAYPCDCWRHAPEPDESAALKALLLIAGLDPPPAPARAETIARLRAAGHPLADLPDAVLAGITRSMLHTNRLVRRHHHRRFPGTLLHVRAALEDGGNVLDPRRWEPYAGGVERLDLPHRHGQLLGAEATRRLVPVLRDWLARCDRLGAG